MSLILAGALTWTLVSRLEMSSTYEQLAKNTLLLRLSVGGLDCHQRTTRGCVTRVASEQEFLDNVSARLGDLDLAGDRLILLDRPRATAGGPARGFQVIYDSDGTLSPGASVPLGRETTVSGQRVREGSATLAGRQYLIAASPASNVYASWVVLARPRDQVVATAARQFLPPIFISGGAGLLLALVVTALLSRALTQPLHELRRAAEDIASGNYSRRVRTAGTEEIGIVGQSFNRMAEAVERARSQQRVFLANVSHELKTPLTSLIGFSQALMDGSLRTDEEKTRAATILHEEAQRVLRMSQELLDLARVESGQLTLNPHPVDLGVQLQQEIEIVRSRAQARGLVLQLSVPASLPPVHADPDRLHQILENLLDNAVKYAPEQTDVWISAEQRAGARVVTAVRNSVGLRPPDPDRMFDRFYRSDPWRSSAGGGAGLGLAISRELAIAQQGTLTAELDADGGLCLRLDLPAASHPVPTDPLPARQPVRLAPPAPVGPHRTARGV